MKTSAVICEFNPFHNGHAYLLQEARKRGATHIITIMSGNFTQRGEPAIFDKYTRTRAALMCGADLVAELPLTYAAAYAERFAYGGVYLAKAFGCTNELVFGSESGDADAIIKAAKAVSDSAVRKLMKYELSGGMTFAAAREKAVFDICGNEISDILGSPNDILGVEYCKALLSLNSAIRPVAVKRIGNGGRVKHQLLTQDAGQTVHCAYLWNGEVHTRLLAVLQFAKQRDSTLFWFNGVATRPNVVTITAMTHQRGQSRQSCCMTHGAQVHDDRILRIVVVDIQILRAVSQ